MVLSFLINIEHSLWWLSVCILVATGITILLYRKDEKLEEATLWQKRVMYSARFLSIFIITFFLLKPFIQFLIKKIEPPHIVFLYDNSASINSEKDSSFYYELYQKTFPKIEEQLASHNISSYHYYFSETIKDSSSSLFSGKYTNISKAIQNAIDLHSDRKMAAIVLISDGIYNRGANPYYLSKDLNIPIYTVGLGDTSSFADIKVENLAINKIGKTKNAIPFALDISAEQVNAKNTNLKILVDDKEVASQKIAINKNRFFKSIKSLIPPIDSGLHKITFYVQAFENEKNIENNKKELYIKIIDTQKEILLLTAAPHPDISAIQQSVNYFSTYKLDVQNIKNFNKSIKKYSLIILHELPNKKYPIAKILKESTNNKIPILSIVSPRTALNYLNKIPSGVSFSKRLNSTEQYQVTFNKDFESFYLNEEAIEYLEHTPPIIGAMLKVKANINIDILAYQKIKNIATQSPLIFFTENNHCQYGYIMGEGIWQWRIYDYQENENFQLFSSFIEKTIQYLSLRSAHQLLDCNIKNDYQETEKIQLIAQLYNKSYEKINEPDLEFELTDSLQKKYSYVFSKEENNYSLNLGMLSAGKYHYKISTHWDKMEYQKSGDFVINPIRIETEDLKANHLLLQKIAKETAANFFYPKDCEAITDSIIQNPLIKASAYNQEKLIDLITLKWLLFVIVSLLSLEWFLRKYAGSI